jgi:alkylresorcinol/alkylpyrone synthase
MTRRHDAPAILGCETALPAYPCPQSDAWERFAPLLSDPAERRKARAIFRNSGVRQRHLIHPSTEYLTARGFGARNRLYQDAALKLALEAARGALGRAAIDPAVVTHLVVATTTGLATPSLDALMVHPLGLRATVQRVPLFGLGCAGGAGSLSRAASLVANDPDGVALVVCAEVCSACFDPADTSPLGAVAASLFGDGAAAMVIGRGPRAATPGPVPRVIESVTHLWPDTRHVMGWEFEDDGFRLVLSRDLPEVLVARVAGPVSALLSRHGVSLPDVRFLVVHPGGPRVIDAIEASLALSPGRLAATRATLAEVGNLSSASVLFVLARVLATERPAPGDLALVLAPGPGFALEASLLSFEGAT